MDLGHDPAGPMPIDSIRPLKGVVSVGAAGGRTIRRMSRAVTGGLPAMSGPSSGFHHPTISSARSRTNPEQVEVARVGDRPVAGHAS